MILLNAAYVFGAFICVLVAWAFVEGFKSYVLEMYDPATIREWHDFLGLILLAGCATASVICAGTLVLAIKP